MQNAELWERLRRLGLHQGAHHLQPPPRRRGQAIEDLISGQVLNTDYGPCFLHRETYELDYRHGRYALAELLAHRPDTPALLAGDERLAEVPIERIAFVDTETTGLAGGTGTYAFLVGVGVFENGRFTVHQFFMRDYQEEPAQLCALGELLDGLEAVVSFNGKAFDLPLLETRFIMTRQFPRLTDAPHLDLLHPARRFWKYRLDSCALSSLEAEVLEVRRTQEDVPGWLIPSLYMEYARSNDAREMPRVFYHNVQDILSLVALTARMCQLLTVPVSSDELPGEDLYGLGRFWQEGGQWDRAESAFRQAVQACRSPAVRSMAMRDLAYLLKRQERRHEGVAWWQQLAEMSRDVHACEELAKHYEWVEKDVVQALAWTERAMVLVRDWPPGPQRKRVWEELKHRQQRLLGKMADPSRSHQRDAAADGE